MELVKHVGRGALITLVASDQNTRYEEEDMDEVFTQLAQTLGQTPYYYISRCYYCYVTNTLGPLLRSANQQSLGYLVESDI